MHWAKISLILCIFGAFKEFRPSESFVTDYLRGPWKNFTDTEIYQDLYPVSTYSQFTTLVVIFLVTDFVRYKPIIILCGVTGIITFSLIIVGQSIAVIQIVEFCYGLFFSAEVAYYTYIYAKVDKKHYQEVTGHTKAAALFGRCMSGIVAQLTTSFNVLDYHQLNYITLSAFVIATLWTFFLPPVGQSIYFHRDSVATKRSSPASIGDAINSLPHNVEGTCNQVRQLQYIPNTKLSTSSNIRRAYGLLWKDFLQAYKNPHVVKWSLWWALSTCGYLQVTSYMQLLWQTAVQPNDKIYNGVVDFLYAMIGAITVFFVGKAPLNWFVIGDITVALCSFLEGAMLLTASYSYNIWLLYAIYILYGVVYHTMVTVASFEVAKHICEDSYGLIFGLNIFFALLFQSILTLIVLNTLGLEIRMQYCVYGSYYIVIAVFYLLLGIFTIIQYHRRGGKLKILVSNKDTPMVHNVRDERSSKSESPS